MDKLINGDCIEEINLLQSQEIKINAIITDPPYVISKQSGYVNNAPDKVDYIKKYGKHKIDFGEWDRVELNLSEMFKCFYELLYDNGTLLFFYDVWKMQEIREIAEEVKFKQPRLCEWIKDNPVPINSKINYLSNAKEYFATFVKKSKPTFDSQYDKGIYNYAICHGKERTEHPTQKPLKLMEEIIRKHTNEGDTILDPFMGSGTTGVACALLNRKFIGIEKSEKYFNIAKKRIEEIKSLPLQGDLF